MDDTLRRKFWDLRNITLPGLCKYSLNGSYGIFSPDRDAKAAIAYDMQQEFRYRRAWFLNPEGGYTVDFGRPLPCEDDPCDFPKAECYDVNGEFRIKVYIDDTQLGVIIDVTPATIRDIHKLLRNCFQQAVKWELMAKNPVIYATVPKYKSAKREIWTAETLMHALEVCEDDRLKLALNLAFSCSLRMGEMLGLTWDCVDISEEAIAEGQAFIYVDKEVQRVDKAAIQELRGKDVILVFPEESKKNKTVRVLKLPKTESSIRKVFLPKSVAEMLMEWKKGQDKIKETLGDEYMDYNLVMATPFGLPIGTSSIRKALNDLIREHDLPPVVFHSLRHTSVTYKLKLNGGDIKAVQGDYGHSQINMVTDVYSHIIDDDRRKNAELFEQAFYEKKNLDPSMQANVAGKTVELPTNVDAELLAKVLSNPEMAALLSTLAKSLESK